ncbi:FAD-dependent oxidoreductase [Paenibacillus mendelii]|uniref:FAD-dependent oxidoreductase n=1 Tax=Paenibacillus mendelii TaxID=206163 RepID=A0ABV6JB67_9BACL|nr:FAD-dependent oxidoreductase [Paenibacillus mendelii]MCQ6562894.1 FAD-dependent oxidoreductase [Paenibacillus mendelii]
MTREMTGDLIIIGGGTGGCAAALAAAKMGLRVILTEETAWIGGQLTSQAVPPDEHRWIEYFGCTRSYRQFRNRVREYYRRQFPMTPAAFANERLNPGNGNVSRLCFDPRVGLSVLHELLAPYVHSGKITILTHHRIDTAETGGDKVTSVKVIHTPSGDSRTLHAPYFIDATECGDVLPLAGVEYVTGAESVKQTGEPHALEGDPQPQDMQAFTFCYAVDYAEGEDHTIDKPRDYEFWRTYQADFWPDKHLSWTYPNPITLKPTEVSLFPNEMGRYPFFHYRRILDRSNFAPGTFNTDISIINWPQNDYWLGSIIDVSEEERNRHLDQAKQLSLSLLYWMQKEAPRPDGGIGYPGLRLRHDVVGTEDGMAMAPYIRESRRIQAEFTILEQHIGTEARGGQGADQFADSVGVGAYRIDLHPDTGGRNFLDISSLPFQIPLGSLIPIRTDNLLPACKNLGVTHITNGCYRLHPVEWNIGEAAGYLAAYSLLKGTLPRHVRNTPELLKDFQALLEREGIELAWPVISPL